MTHWLIAKVDPNKEFVVAKALEQLGHTVWVPTQVTVKRKAVSVGPGITLRRREAIERPLMPSVLFVEYIGLSGNWMPSTRHLQGFWTDCFEAPRLVAEGQLSTFRARVEEVNAAEIARIKKSWNAKRKPRRAIRLGDPSLADQLKQILFGAEQQAAA